MRGQEGLFESGPPVSPPDEIGIYFLEQTTFSKQYSNIQFIVYFSDQDLIYNLYFTSESRPQLKDFLNLFLCIDG